MHERAIPSQYPSLVVTSSTVVPMSRSPCPSVIYRRFAQRIKLKYHTIILGTI